MKRKKERFKSIPGYEGLYEASTWGNIISLPKKYGTYVSKRKIMRCQKHPKGHFIISLKKDGKSRTFWVARIIGKLFVKNPNNLPEINHLDLDKYNNYYGNLEWTTRSGNAKHSWDTDKNRGSNRIPIKIIDTVKNKSFKFKKTNGASKFIGVSRRTILRATRDGHLILGRYRAKRLRKKVLVRK